LALAALGLAAIGQYYFSFVRQNLIDGSVFFAAAIALYLILLRRSEGPAFQGRAVSAAVRRLLDRIRDEPIKAVLVILAFAIAYTTYRALTTKGGPTTYWDVFALWCLSFAVYALAFVRLPRLDVGTWLNEHRKEILTVGGLTLVAAALRFITLGSIPNVVDGDEGLLGTLAMGVLKGNLNNMMATVYGNSTLFLFIMAGVIKVLGPSALALRMLSAVSGTLTIPALYIFARRFFSARVALVAASLLTVSHFHVHFSRVIVATGIQDAFFATLGFYLFLSGLEQRSSSRLVLAGLVMGFELYIYMGARLTILLVPVYILALLIKDRKLVIDNRGGLLAFGGALLVISTPMAFFAVKHPDDFLARVNQLGIIQSGWLAQEAARTGLSKSHILLEQFRKAFLTVNSNPAYAFYFSKLPMLDFLSGALFVLGLAYSLYHVTDRRYLLLNGWFWSGILAGGALIILPDTSAYRLILVFPVVCVLVGLGWDKLAQAASRALPGVPASAIVPTAVVISTFAFLNLKAYFFDFAGSCEFESSNTRLASYIGKYADELGPEVTSYMLTGPRVNYGTYKSIEYLSGGAPVMDIPEPLTAAPTFVDSDSRSAFFFSPEREAELPLVQSRIPGGTIDRVYDCENLLMTVYLSPSVSVSP